jgi:hypothetical protein
MSDDMIREMQQVAQRATKERAAMAARVAVARFVCEHWRAGLDLADRHPLNCVLAALDGETDPNELGIDEEAHADFRLVLHSPQVGLLGASPSPVKRD